MKRRDFQRAFSTTGSKNDNCMKAQVTRLPKLSLHDPIGDSSEKAPHDDEQNNDNNRADDVTQEDIGSFESDCHPVRRSRRVFSRNETPSNIVDVGLRRSLASVLAMMFAYPGVRQPTASPFMLILAAVDL